MKQLVYGICWEADFRQAPRPLGLDGRPVVSLAACDLTAVCSEAPAAAAPNVSSLLAYARVIEQLHQQGTILPLRWGCVLDGPAQVAELLGRRRSEFAESLRRIDGCMEMGLRVSSFSSFPGSAWERPACEALPRVPQLQRQGRASRTVRSQAEPGNEEGMAYLLRRRRHYTQQDAQRQTEAALLVRLREVFAGLFLHSAAEAAGAARVLSVAFLVLRAQEAPFRRAFERFEQRSPQRMFLTGPWPPYTFVAVEAGEPHL